MSLQEGAVFCQLQAGTPKMAPLEYFDPVILAVLGTKGLESTATPKKHNRLFLQLLSDKEGDRRVLWKGNVKSNPRPLVPACTEHAQTRASSQHTNQESSQKSLVPVPSCTFLQLLSTCNHIMGCQCSGTHSPLSISPTPQAHKPSIPNAASAAALTLCAPKQEKRNLS